MARKNLLEGLIAGTGSPADGASEPPAPRRTKGAIGAVGQSISELRARALQDVSADLVDNAGLDDRLDDDAGLESLAESIREYGQQVPVLLRHSPNVEGRYEIVYGRRRVAALKALGLPVRAMVRELKDRDLIVAQGQENTARKGLTFVEKANFARQMVGMGFERKVICDALHVDKTQLSRMLKVVEAIPETLIKAIGSAPSIGRDRWLALAERVAGRTDEAIALARGDSSDGRFEAVFAGLARTRRAAPEPKVLTGADGSPLGKVSRGRGRLVMAFDSAAADGFDDWLETNIERVHREFLKERGDAG